MKFQICKKNWWPSCCTFGWEQNFHPSPDPKLDESKFCCKIKTITKEEPEFSGQFSWRFLRIIVFMLNLPILYITIKFQNFIPNWFKKCHGENGVFFLSQLTFLNALLRCFSNKTKMASSHKYNETQFERTRLSTNSVITNRFLSQIGHIST